MSERKFDGGTFSASFTREVKNFYRKRGEEVRVFLSHYIGVRRKDGKIYPVDIPNWRTGDTVVRFARIVQGEERFLIACDIELGKTAQGRNPDKLTQLIAWNKPDVGLEARPFTVREFWKV